MTTSTRITLEQFLAMPDTKPASEYVCGEVAQKPMPDDHHSFLQGYFFRRLAEFLEQVRLGTVGPERRFVFGPPQQERAFVPDVGYISNERRPPGRRQFAAPDLAIEILSLDQPARLFAAKIQFYLLHGVRLIWVIDPDARTIDVYIPEQDARSLVAGDVLDGGDVLPGFSVAVDDIFAQLDA